MNIGKLIATAREAKGLTQMELAVKAEVSLQQISKIECGKADPKWTTLTRIAGALGIAVESLVAGSQPAATRSTRSSKRSVPPAA